MKWAAGRAKDANIIAILSQGQDLLEHGIFNCVTDSSHPRFQPYVTCTSAALCGTSCSRRSCRRVVVFTETCCTSWQSTPPRVWRRCCD